MIAQLRLSNALGVVRTIGRMTEFIRFCKLTTLELQILWPIVGEQLLWYPLTEEDRFQMIDHVFGGGVLPSKVNLIGL